LWNFVVCFICVCMFFLECVYSLNFVSVLLCIPVLNMQTEFF